jgi:hypothetical protein
MVKLTTTPNQPADVDGDVVMAMDAVVTRIVLLKAKTNANKSLHLRLDFMGAADQQSFEVEAIARVGIKMHLLTDKTPVQSKGGLQSMEADKLPMPEVEVGAVLGNFISLDHKTHTSLDPMSISPGRTQWCR